MRASNPPLPLWSVCQTALATLCVALSACCSLVGGKPQSSAPQLPELRETKRQDARGVFIVVHGLNQRPDTMDDLVDLANDLGYHSYRLSLRGHVQAERDAFPASAWLDDMDAACSLAHARFPNIPLYILGYSLGGLVATHAIDSRDTCKPASMIMIAPALSLRNFVQSGYLLSPFPQLLISVPNVAPSLYRRFAETPLFWYQNLFSLYSKTRTLQSINRLASIPTRIFANPRDELVSLDGLRAWLHDNSLDLSWTIDMVRPKPRNPFVPEHVMIDPHSLGDHEWQHMRESIRNFVDLPERLNCGETT